MPYPPSGIRNCSIDLLTDEAATALVGVRGPVKGVEFFDQVMRPLRILPSEQPERAFQSITRGNVLTLELPVENTVEVASALAKAHEVSAKFAK